MVSYYAKALVSLLISVALIVVQWLTGVYAGGIDGVEWLGLAAILFGPAGLVLAFANTPFSPATKAIVQHVCAVGIVVVQGILHVYDHGISPVEWIGIAGILLSTLAVYVVPNSGVAPATRSLRTNQVGAVNVLYAVGALFLFVGVLLLVLSLVGAVAVSWVVALIIAVAGAVLLYVGGAGGTRHF